MAPPWWFPLCWICDGPPPPVGPVDGGTDVTVVGELLAGGTHLLCRFGTALVTATYTSTPQVTKRNARLPWNT